MEIRYYHTVWNDIKHSPGWLGKLLLLALVNLIPIFGQIVVLGYLCGWARDIAWGVHSPMPSRIFENADGKLYRRGFFALVVLFVIGLLPWLVSAIANGIMGTGVMGLAAWYDGSSAYAVPGTGATIVGVLLSIAGGLLWLAVEVIGPIGCVRMAIYDRLSAGLQLGKIFKMLKHDARGALRILGMYVLVGLIIAAVITAIAVFLMLIIVLGFVAVTGVSYYAYDTLSSDATAAIVAATVVGIALVLAVGYLVCILDVFLKMLVIRAVGYWTYQFDVPSWGAQDDPLPFEQLQQGGGA